MGKTQTLRKTLVSRFSERVDAEYYARSMLEQNKDLNPNRLRRFFRMAELRKRQMLERMLFDRDDK